jgi:hypothetical protein
VNLQVWLQMIGSLKDCLHQLILCGYLLLQLRVVISFFGLVVAVLSVILIPHVHHLRDF